MTHRSTLRFRSRIRMVVERYRWWLGLVFLIILAVSITYQVAPAPAVASPGSSAAQTHAQDPAMQSVLAYLRAHSGMQPAPTPAAQLDSAQQSVMRYIQVHQPAEPPATLWDRLKQAMLGYVGRHGK